MWLQHVRFSRGAQPDELPPEGYCACASRSDVTFSYSAIHQGENVEHNGAFGLSNCSAGRGDEGGNNHVKNVKKNRC